MLKRIISALALMLVLSLCSCTGTSWDGFYKEDLTEYLELGKYKGLTYERLNVTVTDEDVDEVISTMLQSSAELNITDGAVGGSSAVKFDRYCFISGVSTPELSEEGGLYGLYTAYEDPVINSIIRGLVGHVKGDTLEVTVTLPAGYKGVIDADTEATYRITVIEVYERIVPELTDAIASRLMADCKTVAELREKVRVGLEKEQTDSYLTKVEAQLKEKIISASRMKKTPLSVLNEYYDDVVTLYERLAEAKEVPLEDYLKAELGMTLEELERFATAEASEKTKEALVLYSIVKLENITVTDAKLNEFADKMASESLGIFESGEEYMTYYGKNAVTEDYLWSMVLGLAIEYGVAE